jgi:crotonobetainyl-CoA:carnitine CoA-transferase CaiB-like acyl-CoA transferase
MTNQRSPNTAKGPLNGITVIDFSRVLAGPYCSMCLGDMGADVIKIERPDGGDDTRRFGPPFLDGQSTYFMSINRNKRSIALDLKHPDTKAIINRLLASADIVLENFRPGTMDKLGYGKKECWSINPKLIYCSISAFGHRGNPEWSSKPGYDLILQGMGGIPSITGASDGSPSKVGASIADVVSGMNAFSGILLALIGRAQTNQGQHVDISMQEGQLALHTYLASAWLNAGVEPPRNGNRHLSIAPYSTYQAQDGWINIAVANQKLWSLFCAAIERDDLENDPRFVTNTDRVEHIEVLDTIINQALSAHSIEHWTTALGKQGIPSGPVMSIRQALEHPQVSARSLLVSSVMNNGPAFRSVGPAFGISLAPTDPSSSAPNLGGDTHSVLQGCEFTAAEIATFLATGAAVAAQD